MFKELTVEEWKTEIARGLEFRRLYGNEDKWAQLEALAANADTSMAVHGPNLIYSFQDDLASSLHVPNPQLVANPMTMREVDSAPIVEATDNRLIKELKVKREMEIATNCAYLWGTTVLKIGYDSEFGWDPNFDFNGQKNPFGMSLTQIDKKQWYIEFNEIEPGMPWVKACLPHDIVVPWGTRDLDCAPWIAHRVVRHVEDCKADPKYKTRNLKPVMSMTDFVKSYQTVMKPYRLGADDFFKALDIEGEAEYVELWEIHDKRTGKVYVIATGHDSFLRNDRNHLQLVGLPFVELGFTPKTRNFWRTSDATYLFSAQAELTDIALQSSKQRRANVLKFLYNKGAITEAELLKLMSAEVGTAASVNGGQDLRNAIMPMQQSTNQNLYAEADFVRQNARETTGFTKTQAGEYAGARTSATEVGQVQQARQTRMTRRQMCVAEAYIECFRKINEIIFKYWKTPRIAQIVGPEGLQQWMQFTGSELKGSYSYDLTFEDAPMQSQEQQQQMAMQAYMMAAQDPTLDPMAARRFLGRAFRNVNIASIFNPQMLGGGPGGAPGMQPPGANPGQQQQGAVRPPAGGGAPQGGGGQRQT